MKGGMHGMSPFSLGWYREDAGTLGQALPDEAVVGRYHRAFGIIRGRFVADAGQACGRWHP